jgi:hypothetical protein
MFSRRAFRRTPDIGFNSFIFFPQEFPCRSSFPAILIVRLSNQLRFFSNELVTSVTKGVVSSSLESKTAIAMSQFRQAQKTAAVPIDLRAGVNPVMESGNRTARNFC